MHAPWATTLLLLVLWTGPGLAQADPELLDKGSFVVSVNGRPVGREEFRFIPRADSLVVTSTATWSAPGSDGDEQEFKKVQTLSLGAEDLAFRGYYSNETVGRHLRIRGIVASTPTTLTIIDEVDGRGSGDVFERPPGRFIVLDPRLYTLLAVIPMSLKGQSFDRRPIHVVSLAPRDTITEAEIVRQPPETIRWGSRPVQADRLQLVQGPVTFDLWMDRQGRVLRIAHVPSGLLVEREAPKVKPPGKPPKRGG